MLPAAQDLRTLVFLHIFKAGGTTLHRMLERNITEKAMWRVDLQRAGSVDALRNSTPGQRAAIRCLRGHLPFGLHTYVPQPAGYITLVRDPVARFLSQYRHCRRDAANARAIGIPDDATATLEAYIAFETKRGVMNLQTRLISGEVDLHAPAPPYAPLSPDALERAMANLDAHFLAAASTEQFDAFAVWIADAMGWPHVDTAPVNVDYGRRQPLDPSVTQRLKELNALDGALVEHVHARFAAACAAREPAFHHRVAHTQRRARRVGIWRQFVHGRLKRILAPSHA